MGGPRVVVRPEGGKKMVKDAVERVVNTTVSIKKSTASALGKCPATLSWNRLSAASFSHRDLLSFPPHAPSDGIPAVKKNITQTLLCVRYYDGPGLESRAVRD